MFLKIKKTCYFANRNFTDSVNFAPDLKNFRNLKNVTKMFLPLNLMKFVLTPLKINFFGSKPILNLPYLNSLLDCRQKFGAKN